MYWFRISRIKTTGTFNNLKLARRYLSLNGASGCQDIGKAA